VDERDKDKYVSSARRTSGLTRASLGRVAVRAERVEGQDDNGGGRVGGGRRL
jgi:hypothetical protein